MKLVKSREYKRTDLHEYFGGQRQGGISTPKEKSVVLIFSSEQGEKYGYQDGWNEEGNLFYYTGEGQHGHMTLTKGNLAVYQHSQRAKVIHLFQYVRKAYVRYEGEMRCLDYMHFTTPDKGGVSRRAIKFVLEPVESTVAGRVEASLNRKPNITERSGVVVSRVGQGQYRKSLIDKFKGVCAATGCDQEEILIASHILPWRLSTDEERLDVDNGILLSPHYDALFDRHLISFADDGKIVFSKCLKSSTISSLGISEDVRIPITKGMVYYLSKHREQLSKGLF